MKTIPMLVALATGLAAAIAQENTPSQSTSVETPAVAPAAKDSSTSRIRAQARLARPLPVLGHLEIADHVVLVHPRHRYSIRTKAGRKVAEGITLETMRGAFPDIYKFVTSAVAAEIHRRDDPFRAWWTPPGPAGVPPLVPLQAAPTPSTSWPPIPPAVLPH